MEERPFGWSSGHRYSLSIALSVLSNANAPPESLRNLLTADVGQTESSVVHERSTHEVRHYEPDETAHGTPVLIVYALVNRPYILDLQPDRSVIRRLLEAGFEVYLVDWGRPSVLDQSLGVADYVTRYLDACVDAVCDHAAVEDVHLLGYCMGGTLAVMYTALRQRRVRTLGLMAAPSRIDDTGGLLERWAAHCDPGTIAETFGNVPGESLALTFAMMEPVDQLVGKYVHLAERVDDPDFVANFARMERWVWDSVDVPGEAYREFIEEIYRQDRLLSGEYHLDGERVDPSTIEVPLLQVVGEYDHLVPPEASTPLNDAVASEDTRLIEFPAGHVGVSVSSSAHERLWPTVAEWYGERSESVE
ncbi:alpha/beta fold hydrolase [Halovenus marina]|uniref:alpha/beta fold hydrolase n=1 Tax=Halovenus marina TaxID=3396621 RepID=UPI003F54A128